MKALTCEMCGSTDLIKDSGVYVCQSCGTKYTVEEAKKMMVEGTVDVKGTVKIDSSSDLKNLYEIARRAKDNQNDVQAEKYYDQILVKDPSSWEANFYAVYFKVISCNISDISNAAASVGNSLKSVVELIKEKIKDEEEQNLALTEIYTRCSNLSGVFCDAALNYYESIDLQIQNDYVEEYVDNAIASIEVINTLGDLIENIFGGNYNSLPEKSWEDALNLENNYLCILSKDISDNTKNLRFYATKIQRYNPDYKLPIIQRKQGGCYVATAVYGSYDCPEVWTLRRFRDNTLDSTWYGRLFIKTYYAISPTLVKWFGNTAWFKNFWRGKLDKMVINLREKGVESTPYIDKY